MSRTGNYIVVFMAGYVGEKDLHAAKSYALAQRWLSSHYENDEIEDNHNEIAFKDFSGNRTYEI